MKTIITIIILLLIGWGVWYFTKGEDIDNQGAAAGNALNASAQESTNAEADIDLGEFEDKG